jgi:hypothetical protein
MAKPEPEHTDILGQPLSEGCHVAMTCRNQMMIGKIIKMNPKMLRVIPIGKTFSTYRSEEGYLVYGSQTVRLDGPDALAYILKASN